MATVKTRLDEDKGESKTQMENILELDNVSHCSDSDDDESRDSFCSSGDHGHYYDSDVEQDSSFSDSEEVDMNQLHDDYSSFSYEQEDMNELHDDCGSVFDDEEEDMNQLSR